MWKIQLFFPTYGRKNPTLSDKVGWIITCRIINYIFRQLPINQFSLHVGWKITCRFFRVRIDLVFRLRARRENYLLIIHRVYLSTARAYLTLELKYRFLKPAGASTRFHVRT